MSDEAESICLKIDFENAFNNVSRKIVLDRVHKYFPGILEWVNFCYHQPSLLFINQRHFLSAEGVQQGDPLGPLLFSLVLQELILNVKERCPELYMNAWYLDDRFIAGKVDVVHKAFEFIKNEGNSLGLHLNIRQCELFWPSRLPDTTLFPPEVLRVQNDGCRGDE
ncbi:hypothetical protein ROZALSC1DRAFT_26279 [Rozella allomycis CSF55]|uniref:Reverse transcriptase domain-containing protein n=1 Tax=Rozella allomycis (strain CSF55) TaxID=988480 RepID=A0A4P9Y8Y5_ROZAC|nr:hypothetical protein ROZALSC1DRAFT_26279 [Rozella allomycis CSF55]